MNRSSPSTKHTEPGAIPADHGPAVRGTPIDNVQPAIRLIHRKQVESLTGLSRSTIYALMKTNQLGFPKPVKVSFRRVGWVESDIVTWITARIAATRSSAGDPE